MASKKNATKSRTLHEPMPGKQDNRAALARQWEILGLLPTQGDGMTMKEIHEALSARGFGECRRTIERDMEVLPQWFPIDAREIPITNNSTQTHYRWRNARGFNFPALTIDDALTIKLAESALKTLMPVELLQGLGPRFQAATDRLAQMKGQTRNARWPNLVRAIPRTFELAPPRISAGILESVQEALLASEQLDIEYQSLQDATFEARRISPHALLHKGQVTYVVATRDPEKGLRTYALHRMKSAKLTGLKATRSDFDLDAYIANEAHEPGPNTPITLEARVNANLAKILSETPLNPDMTMKSDGAGFRIKAEVRENQALYRWILGHGKAIEILRPTSLRKSIADTVRAAADHYA
jgi:predicted DNA-binding transcriptional regulator YafY